MALRPSGRKPIEEEAQAVSRMKDFSPSRRRFLQMAGAAGFGLLATPEAIFAQYRYLAPVKVDNPLEDYPNRDWERMYRDIYRTDESFVFLCCPNDTHNCLLNAFVKNNVVVRIEPTYAMARPETSTAIRPRTAGILGAARRGSCSPAGSMGIGG